jgi:hypothetical protein
LRRLKIPLKKKMGSVVHHINEKWAIPCNLPKFTVFHSTCVELRQWDKLDDESSGAPSKRRHDRHDTWGAPTTVGFWFAGKWDETSEETCGDAFRRLHGCAPSDAPMVAAYGWPLARTESAESRAAVDAAGLSAFGGVSSGSGSAATDAVRSALVSKTTSPTASPSPLGAMLLKSKAASPPSSGCKVGTAGAAKTKATNLHRKQSFALEPKPKIAKQPAVRPKRPVVGKRVDAPVKGDAAASKSAEEARSVFQYAAMHGQAISHPTSGVAQTAQSGCQWVSPLSIFDPEMAAADLMCHESLESSTAEFRSFMTQSFAAVGAADLSVGVDLASQLQPADSEATAAAYVSSLGMGLLGHHGLPPLNTEQPMPSYPCVASQVVTNSAADAARAGAFRPSAAGEGSNDACSMSDADFAAAMLSADSDSEADRSSSLPIGSMQQTTPTTLIRRGLSCFSRYAGASDEDSMGMSGFPRFGEGLHLFTADGLTFDERSGEPPEDSLMQSLREVMCVD